VFLVKAQHETGERTQRSARRVRCLTRKLGMVGGAMLQLRIEFMNFGYGRVCDAPVFYQLP